jgi:hypothetical protein
VNFAGNTFRPGHAPKAALSADEAYSMISNRKHWPAGVIVQYGRLTGLRNHPVGVWAFEGISTCSYGGLGVVTREVVDGVAA